MKTRRESLSAAAVAGAALTLGASPARAAGEDKGFLELMVGYQDSVVFAYETVLRSISLDARERAILRSLRNEAEQAAVALRKVLAENGGAPPARTPGALAKLPPDMARRTSREQLLRAVIRSEDNAMSGWFVALQKFKEPRVTAGAAAFMRAAGKRLVTLRDLAGQELLPRAFETGTR